MVTVKQLRHLTAIAEQGNMHKAAQALHLTQPALTRSLNTLESLLDVKLFDRHSGGMQATPFCLEIIEQCQQVLLDVEDIQRAARIYQNVEAGELSIGVGRGLHGAGGSFLLQGNTGRLPFVDTGPETIAAGPHRRPRRLAVVGVQDVVLPVGEDQVRLPAPENP